MKPEFKVLEWLREVRDRHAREVEGLTPEQRLAALDQETRAWNESFFKQHPQVRPGIPPRPAERVAETPAVYGNEQPPAKPK